METSGKVVATMVAVFVVVGGAVMLSIVRLAGIITWPPVWAVFAVVGVILAPLALLLLSSSKTGGYSDGRKGLLQPTSRETLEMVQMPARSPFRGSEGFERCPVRTIEKICSRAFLLLS
jgi:hypothetical protein